MNRRKVILKKEEIIFKTDKDIYENDLLFCLHCGSTFPASQLKIDFLGNRQGCGSLGKPDCNGAGIGIDIWDANSDFVQRMLKNPDYYPFDFETSKKYGSGEIAVPVPPEPTIEEKQKDFIENELSFLIGADGVKKMLTKESIKNLYSLEHLLYTCNRKRRVEILLDRGAPQQIIETELLVFQEAKRGLDKYKTEPHFALKKMVKAKEIDFRHSQDFILEILSQWDHIYAKKNDVFNTNRILPGPGFSKER